jgi:hypothetical protein
LLAQKGRTEIEGFVGRLIEKGWRLATKPDSACRWTAELPGTARTSSPSYYDALSDGGEV